MIQVFVATRSPRVGWLWVAPGGCEPRGEMVWFWGKQRPAAQHVARRNGGDDNGCAGGEKHWV